MRSTLTYMKTWKETLDAFIVQAHTGELKTSSFPKEYHDLRTRVSFGMGAPARVPWIGFLAPEMRMSNGINPVYLYYKNIHVLVLAYGVGETVEPSQSWPNEIITTKQTIETFLKEKIPRYGNSFVFKAYKVTQEKKKISYAYYDTDIKINGNELETDLLTITDYYKKMIVSPSSPVALETSQGLFYMEKQLEDFIIHNWKNTELGKKYDLIIEEGELLSQQYRTDIGPIDILAKDKKTNSYVVIELKRNQTSDDTVGQLTRYMGWIKKELKDKNVKGVIIARQYDKKLDYAREMVPNIEVFIYQVNFKLDEFK